MIRRGAITHLAGFKRIQVTLQPDVTGRARQKLQRGRAPRVGIGEVGLELAYTTMYALHARAI